GRPEEQGSEGPPDGDRGAGQARPDPGDVRPAGGAAVFGGAQGQGRPHPGGGGAGPGPGGPRAGPGRRAARGAGEEREGAPGGAGVGDPRPGGDGREGPGGGAGAADDPDEPGHEPRVAATPPGGPAGPGSHHAAAQAVIRWRGVR